MILRCEPCMGRGWVQISLFVWPNPCPRCDGRGRFTVNELARLIDEDPLTLKNLLEMKRTHFAAARRIFAKLITRWPDVTGRRFVF